LVLVKSTGKASPRTAMAAGIDREFDLQVSRMEVKKNGVRVRKSIIRFPKIRYAISY
jgi:hypothetical protein